MSKWRVWYSDGSTFSSEDGSPNDAPSEGFICAVGYNESNQRYIMYGFDYYCWDLESKQWWGMNEAGLKDRLRRDYTLVYAYKEGRTVKTSLFEELMRKAGEDPEFPN